MYPFPISVMSNSFRLPYDAVMDTAAALGATGIQLAAVNGEFTPDRLQAGDRKALLRRMKDHGLVFSALCGDLGHGFGDAAANPDLIEASKRIIDLALDLETNIVTTHIGVVPADPQHPRYAVMQEACYALAEYAHARGAHFAVETGPEPSSVLKGFLDSLGSDGVCVNLDPANLVMVIGEDPVQAVYNLKDYIVHTHAKDGIKLLDGNPEFLYGVTHPAPVEYEGKRFYCEMPLGEGHVPFDRYLKALEDIGYRGFLAIEREVGEDPVADIRMAGLYLKKLEESL